MAARKNKAKSTPLTKQLLDRLYPYQREIAGAVLLLMAVLTLLGLLSLSGGWVSDWWAAIFRQLFGWGAMPAAALVGILGALLTFGRLKEEGDALPLDIIIGLELLFVVTLSLMHLLAIEPGPYAVRLAREGGGGGFVGWGLSNFLVELVGQALAIFFLIGLGVAALGLVVRMTIADVAIWADLLHRWATRRLAEKEVAQSQVPEPELAEKASAAPPQKKKAAKEKGRPSSQPEKGSDSGLTTLPRTRRAMPPLELLATPAKDPGRSANARYQAQIIEDTLRGFGIPAEVVEINTGPTVTQFGLKLETIERTLADGSVVQQRTRVNKVTALNKDLALALSAAPIRIEAPVPGRPLVGIEVPNTDKTMVSLRAVIESADFKKNQKPLYVALGKGVSGRAVSASLTDMPHLLIAGATGSGKSVCINALITTLLFTHGPEQLRLLMIDPKMVELTSFNGIPHLIAPVVTDFEQVVGALAWVTREMDRRYKLFATSGARSIGSYNQKLKNKDEALPYMVVVIDELADLMMMAPDEVERHICRIAQMARATGIHLVIATQRPSTDVVTGLIKANFPTRIAFAVSSQIDSRVILDSSGAERLLGRGDMLYMAADSPKLVRLQGCFVSDPEIQNVVGFWQRAVGGSGRAVAEAPEEPSQAELPWAGILADADKDDMLEEAIQLVIESGRASTSMLQRRLGIGYPRASRMMDQLEEEGVVGPADGSKPREVFWQEDEDESDYDELERDVRGQSPPGNGRS